MTEDKDEISSSRKTQAFLSTMILVPLLFVGTCVPLGFVSISMGSIGLVIVYVLAFLVFLIRKAVKTENPGTRWGIIVIIALALLGAIIFVLPDLIR